MLTSLVAVSLLTQGPASTTWTSDGSASPAPAAGANEAGGAASEAGLGAEALIAPPPSGERAQAIVGGAAAYQFRTDFEDGGDLATTRFALGTQFRFAFSEQLSLGLNLGYRFDRYEFGGNVFPSLGPGVNPWRDIQTVGLGAVLAWRLDDQWTLSGGPIGQFSGEESVDAGDAASGGGLIAASYRVSESLLLGGGVGVLSRIEDDPAVFPIILVEWRINDQLRLSTRGGPTAVLREGAELIWSPVKQLELALGARYEYVRFRLSEGNTFSDGIGEEQAIPIWLRASWLPTANIRLDFFGGLAPWGEIKLSDRSGDVLAEADLDPAPFIAGYLSIGF